MPLSAEEMTTRLFDVVDMISKSNDRKNQNRVEKAIIVDASDHSHGRYAVNNGSAKYIATCSNTELIKGLQVLVFIEDGDFSKEKVIIDRCISTETDATLLESPLSRCQLSNEDLVKTQENITLYLNKSDKTTADDNPDKSEKINIALNEVTNGDVSVQGNQYIGISADFKAPLTNLGIIKGDYGIMVEIEYKNEKEGNVYTKLYPLSAKDEMIGDVYNFVSFFPQAALYELDLNNTILSMRAWAYQDGTFGSANSDITDEEIQNGTIEIKNISIKFGKDKSALSEVDDVKLICNNGLFYDPMESESENQKTINLKWQFTDKENSKYFDISDMSSFKEAIGLDAYKIYWYRASTKTIEDQLNDFDKQYAYYTDLDNYIAEYLEFYDKYIDKIADPSINDEDSAIYAKQLNEYYMNLVEPLGEGAFTIRTFPNGLPYSILTNAGLETAKNIQNEKDRWTEEKRNNLEYALLLGGQNWEYIESATDKFTLAGFVPKTAPQQDAVKAVIEYGLTDKEGKIKVDSPRYKVKITEPLYFKNVSYAYLAEKEKNFTIIPNDGSGGSYYIYSTDDSLLVDRGEAAKTRSMTISFMDNKRDLVDIKDIIIWKLPKNNSMLNFDGTIGGTEKEPNKFGKILTLDELNKVLLDNKARKGEKTVDSSYFLGPNESFNDFYFVQRNYIFEGNVMKNENIGIDGATVEYDETAEKIRKEINKLKAQEAEEYKTNQDLRKVVGADASRSDSITTVIEKKITPAVSTNSDSGPNTNTPQVTSGGEWNKQNGSWYYVKNKANITGWHYIKWSKGTNWFYFDSTGKMLTGWQNLEKSEKKNWFYFDENGAMQTGWKKVAWKGAYHWHYFDDNGAMQKGWHELKWSKGTNWFYFSGNGYMLTGWQQLNRSGKTDWFYFNADGAMQTGWQYIEYKKVKDWYHFDEITGTMDADKAIDGAKLTFSKNGDLIKIESPSRVKQLEESNVKLKDLNDKIVSKEMELSEYMYTVAFTKYMNLLKTQKYYIRPFYNSNISNNIVKCYIIKKDNQISEATLKFVFGQQSLIASDYNFVVRFGSLVDRNFKVIDDTKQDVALTLIETKDDENKYQEIIFSVYGPDNNEINLTDKKKNDIIKLWKDGSEQGYYAGYNKKDNLEFVVHQNKNYYDRVAIRPVWKDKNNNKLSITDFSNIVLQAKYSTDTGDLIQLFPLHFRKVYKVTKDKKTTTYKQHYLVGSEFIVYNLGGANPKYCETFKLVNYDNNREINGKFKFNDINFDDYVSFENDKQIKPKTIYDPNKKSSGVVFEREKELVYTFPLVALKNRYQVALIDNRTTTAPSTLTNNTAVVESVMTSGTINANNAFTGVVMGSVANNNNTTSSGLFGYQQGVPSYGFNSDGTAFLGRESDIDTRGNIVQNNGGRIQWNDNGGIIKSGDPSTGLYVDLADGSVISRGDFNLIGRVSQKARKDAGDSGVGSTINFSGNDSTVEMGLWYYPKDSVTAPFMTITDGQNSFVFDKDNFYLQNNKELIGNNKEHSYYSNIIDLKNGEINFSNKFKVDNDGQTSCYNLKAIWYGELGPFTINNSMVTIDLNREQGQKVFRISKDGMFIGDEREKIFLLNADGLYANIIAGKLNGELELQDLNLDAISPKNLKELITIVNSLTIENKNMQQEINELQSIISELKEKINN